MPEHVGHPSRAEEALQEIVEEPRVSLTKHLRAIAECLRDGTVTAQEQLLISGHLVDMALEVGDIGIVGARGKANVDRVITMESQR